MSLLAIVSNVSDEKVLRYTMSLVDDLLDCNCRFEWALRCSVLVGCHVCPHCLVTGMVFAKLSQRVDLFRPRSEGGTKAPANAAPFLRLITAAKHPFVVTKAARAAAVLLRFVLELS
jgi:hypothetical protein